MSLTNTRHQTQGPQTHQTDVGHKELWEGGVEGVTAGPLVGPAGVSGMSVGRGHVENPQGRQQQQQKHSNNHFNLPNIGFICPFI